MKKIIIPLPALFLAVWCITGVVQAGIAVKPANMVISLENGRPAGRFVIANNGDVEERFRISATHFSYSEHGAMQVVQPDGRSLAPWVKFNPKEFTLPANSKRAVRFVVVPRGALASGEYWGAMELESLDYKEASGNDGKGRKYTVRVVPSVLVPIYGTVGEVRYEAAINDASIIETDNGTALRVLVANVGDGRLMMDGSFTITDTYNQPVSTGRLSRGLVLPGKHRYLTSAIDGVLSSGDYLLSIDYGARTMGDKRIKEEFAFHID